MLACGGRLHTTPHHTTPIQRRTRRPPKHIGEVPEANGLLPNPRETLVSLRQSRSASKGGTTASRTTQCGGGSFRPTRTSSPRHPCGSLEIMCNPGT